MSGRAATPDTVAACASCLRRSWLLAALGGPLDYQSRDRERLMDTLALGDRELMRALAGRRRSELQAEHAAFAADRLPRAEGVQAGALSPSCPAARPCGAGPRWPPCASAWGSRT